MNAVGSEHDKNLNNDFRRNYQILKSNANQQHPFHKFSTGNVKTLNISNIRSRLLQFHDTYYSSNVMKLVILGKGKKLQKQK